MPDTPHVTVHRFGQEKQPVVQIDGFSGDVGGLIARGRAAEYQDGGASYPGIRPGASPIISTAIAT